ncbi:TonB-dependent receptor domain-containing protein [Nitrosococcus watsonii]|uniref:TonB-dependent receptor n=1 Tax=Nitrosococcus watsoni (strain C-113) TaxID=105559 RepID=D8K7C6_NITWC|nr:TonB-dependent receptor [Nitrosococcus watsonii]ADJ28803.1 TonB-dependent receptor [Nitrosococcus watsonii C-113]
MRLRLSGLWMAFVAFWPFWVEADEHCASPVAQIVSLQGRVEVTPMGERRWRPVGLREKFCAGDKVRIEAYSRALVQLQDNTLLHLDGGTLVTFSGIEPNKPSWFELLKGAIHLISRFPHRLEVKTPFVNAAVEGTEFAVRVEPEQALLWVFEGRVLFHNPAGRLTITSGEAAVAEAGQAPRRRLVVQPREAVQWALYYPPLIDLRSSVYPTDPAAREIHAALHDYRAGDLPAALARLEQVPIEVREASYFTLQAALLLVVGRVDEARSKIQHALQLDPDQGTAYALQAIIALVQNQKEKALSLAQQAAKLDPRSPIPQIALSYVYQGMFNIERALAHAQQAIELFPGAPLAWARVAELQLSLGNSEKAAKAAQQAVALDPDLARTQTVQGFADLTAIDIEEAKGAFKRAIELDPADPLSRLGLGLAKIRQGDLKAGTQEIEIAASLDPNNSLIRSYLGKAYYDQKRGGAAATELAMAKKLDPNDPTPWFYDAIRKQTTNRPVEALHDMQKAIALNDNRAVYRSRLLMDQDLAARSASLGRIYHDLGFQQRGLLEGWKSVNTDPGNYSAHRLLADNYAALPRHETARVSELLRSQLLQPLNMTPVQPQLAEGQLLLLPGSGPAASAFNEFNPLFTRNRFALQTSAVVGSNSTFGDEVTQAGIWNQFSYSLGQFHFGSDGFRKNNDLEHNIYNAFAQVALGVKTSAQIELRRQEIDSGDLRSRFDLDPEEFKDDRRRTRRNSARLGFRHNVNSEHNLLGSFIYWDGDSRFEDVGPQTELVSTIDTQHYSGELQYLFHGDNASLTGGFGYFTQDSTSTTTLQFNSPFFPPGDTTTIAHPDSNYANAYAYANIALTPTLRAILGLSFDHYQEQDPLLEHNRLNPKFGLLWNLSPATTLRTAVFRTVKRPFAASPSIEPTQVAGFNQFFDDLNGAKTLRYGVGLDHAFSSQLSAGVEISWRQVEESKINTDKNKVRSREGEAWDEQFHRAYLYWTPTDQLAFSAEYFLEYINRKNQNLSSGEFKVLTTHRMPLRLNYYHPKGLIARVGGSYVYQDADFPDTKNSGIEDFWVMDASLGYRLPKRWGIVSIEAFNLLNNSFRFQDLNFQSGEPTVPLFRAERLIFARFTLAF